MVVSRSNFAEFLGNKGPKEIAHIKMNRIADKLLCDGNHIDRNWTDRQ